MAEQTTATSGETAAGTAVPAGHEGKGGFPPFESSTFASQLLWFAIAFGLLYWLMAKVALPRVAGILEHRRDKIAADLDAAQRMKAESDAAVASYEKALADARAKAQSTVAETRDAANAEAEAVRKDLEDKLGDKLKAAEAQIAATKTEALGNVRTIAAEAASVIVQQLTGKAPTASAIESALKSVSGRG